MKGGLSSNAMIAARGHSHAEALSKLEKREAAFRPRSPRKHKQEITHISKKHQLQHLENRQNADKSNLSNAEAHD